MRPLWVLSLLVWLLLLWYLSLVGSPPVPDPGVSGFDKVEHAGAYAVLTVLCCMVFRERFNALTPFVHLALLASAHGLLIEFLQKVMGNGRSFESGDIIANSVGSIGGCIVGWYLLKRREGGRENDAGSGHL